MRLIQRRGERVFSFIFASIFFMSLTTFSPVQLFAQEKSLNIWTSNENVKNALLKSAQDFEKDYNVKVVIDVLNKDLTSQFKTAAMTSKGPDILCWAHDVVGELAESGLIEPLKLPPHLKKQFLPVTLKAFTYKKNLYGYPYAFESVALLYNKDLIAEPPSSMEQIVELDKKWKAQKKKQHVFLYDIKNFFFSYGLWASQGAYIFKDNDGSLDVQSLGLDISESLSATKFLFRLVNEGVIPDSTDRSIAFDFFKRGELAMTIDGPWAINDLKKAGINYGVSPIPNLNGQPARPFVGSHGLLIRRSSSQKKLAKEFIENYLVTEKGIRNIYEKDPRGPTRMDLVSALSSTNPDLLQFMKSAQYGMPMPNVPEMGAVWGAMGKAFELIFTRQSKVDEGLKMAQKQVKQSLSKGK